MLHDKYYILDNLVDKINLQLFVTLIFMINIIAFNSSGEIRRGSGGPYLFLLITIIKGRRVMHSGASYTNPLCSLHMYDYKSCMRAGVLKLVHHVLRLNRYLSHWHG